jgi:hypothetical protein
LSWVEDTTDPDTSHFIGKEAHFLRIDTGSFIPASSGDGGNINNDFQGIIGKSCYIHTASSSFCKLKQILPYDLNSEVAEAASITKA